MRFYAMAGLPRSGSTLLSTLINQHPEAYSSASTPVFDMLANSNQFIGNHELYKAEPKESAVYELMKSIPRAWYHDKTDKQVVVDKSRAWTNQFEYLKFAEFETPILTCVRDLDEVIASFIRLVKKNPFKGEGKMNFIDRDVVLQGYNEINDRNRCLTLIGETGVVGRHLNQLRDIYEKKNQDKIHIIEYNDLVEDTQATMDKVFEMLKLDPVPIKKEGLKSIHAEKDAEIYGLEGMHTVKKTIEKTTQPTSELLDEEILKACEGTAIWRTQ